MLQSHSKYLSGDEILKILPKIRQRCHLISLIFNIVVILVSAINKKEIVVIYNIRKIICLQILVKIDSTENAEIQLKNIRTNTRIQ